MEHTTVSGAQKKEEALLAGEPAITSSGSIIDGADSTLERSVALHIVNPEDMDFCSFWVGLFPQGELAPQDLLGTSDDYFGALELAAKQGLKEQDPVMVSDTVAQPARFLYLMPAPTTDFRERFDWIARVADTVKSWAPDRIGIYLTPDLIKQLQASDLLNQLLRQLINGSNARDYFLIPGGHGFNTILNAALELKAEMLDESQGVSVFIYH